MRALLFLLERGQLGERYFLVDDSPVPSIRLAEEAARALKLSLRVLPVPPLLVRLYLGPIVADSLGCDANLSNGKLSALGFRLRFPTIEEGIPRGREVLGGPKGA